MKRSALTLRGLVHADSGSIMAAATTSLPEEIGGVRNWDYRYCWLRDAALTATALVSVGSTDEAENYLDWVHRVLETLPGPERRHPSTRSTGLRYRQRPRHRFSPDTPTRPVRVGNAADQRVQLDVFGPIVSSSIELANAREKAGDPDPLSDRDWELVCAMVETVQRHGSNPITASGEIRDNPRHHVYSRLWAGSPSTAPSAATFQFTYC